MKERIVITGMGAITPAGVGVPALSKALQEARSCVHKIEAFETSDLPCRVAATVPSFQATDFLPFRDTRKLDRTGQLFVASAQMALKDSALNRQQLDTERIGIFESTSLGGLNRALRELENFLTRGYSHINPLTLTAAMTGNGGGMLSPLFSIQGPLITFSNGSISSATALVSAVQHLLLGEIDVAVVGGSEAPISRPILAVFNRARVLTTHNDPPETACCPFDTDRDGIVLGEGGAVLVLERLEYARKRDARIYAEVAGVALTADAWSLVAPEPQANQQARAILKALKMAGLSAGQIDYISAHGTGTRLNDRVETHAIKKSMGEAAYRIPVSSSKAMLGHTLGACSVVEIIKTILAMWEHFIPPTLNLTTPDPECDLDYVPQAARPGDIHRALVKNSSFSGKNSAIVLKNWEES